MKVHRLWYSGLAIAVVACVDRSGPVEPSSSTKTVDAAAIAQAFAVGLAAPEVRAAVRDAMRASPVTEPKLLVRDFVNTMHGGALVRAAVTAARACGRDA